MPTIVQAAPISNKAIWAGRLMSGLVILFLLLDGAMKLIPLDVVIKASEPLGIPGDLARTLGVLTLVCNIVDFTLEPRGGVTQLTWAMRGSCAYMARLMGLVLDMDKMIGSDFEAGLANLKTLAEK